MSEPLESAPQVGGTNRHRPDEAAASAGGRDPRARGAIIALAVAAIGTVGFVVGLRVALQRAPAERPAALNDSARTAAEYDSVSSARRRTAPRAPNEAAQPADLPRLR